MANSSSITITGFDNLARKIEGSSQRLVAKVAADLLVELKKNTPVRTGHARSGWTTTKKGKDYVDENPVPYVPYLDKGTKKMKPANGGRGIIGPSLTSIKGKYK